MRTLGAALALACIALSAPALAAAATYEVDSADGGATLPPGNGCSPTFDCTLRDAIERANETAEADTIEFGGLFADTIALSEPLPAIVQPVTIDATTALDYTDAGHPVILLDGSAIPAVQEARGIEIEAASRVEGLAIGGFRLGVFAYSGAPSFICGNYVGVEPDGVTALPNEYAGIANAPGSKGLRIGAECEAGNLISGNEEFGILEAGEGTVIGDNWIGLDADGLPLPNGSYPEHVSAGIFVNPAAIDAFIGGKASPGGWPANTIAYNDGPGVRVYDAGSDAEIRGNPIFANLLGEIDFVEGTPTPAPLVDYVRVGPGDTEAAGTLTGAQPNAQYELDFFASEACESGPGEGEAFLGEASVETDAGGSATFSTGGLAVPPGGREELAATATHVASGSSSAFSSCSDQPFPPLPPPDPPPSPGPSAGASVLAITALQAPAPVNGETVAVAPVSGKVFVQRPGESKPTQLREGQTIPIGSVVDATRGRVTLTSVNRAGDAQTAVFYGGRFLVARQEGNGLVVLKLRGGNLRNCAGGAGRSVASASGKKGRRLWGSGKGRFRTEGNYGSATVRGTVWLTEDRCDGTLFKVRKGFVTVRDFVAGINLALAAGRSYLARKGG